MTKAVRWVAVLAAIALLLQAGWWLVAAVEVARLNSSPLLDGLAHCQREYDLIGVGCSPSLTPDIPMGVYLMLNLVVATLLAVMALKLRVGRVA